MSKDLILDLTIAIPVKNEAKNLPGCLEAIGKDLAKEIIIIDSGSTDSTKQIAASYGASFVDFKWNGKFPKKRNWLLRNYSFKTNWILFLDADEYLTSEFRDELRKALSSQDNYSGYWLNYSIYFMGKQLKGGYPLKKLALFKIGSGEYERIDEEKWSTLDMEIHEHPIIEGKTGLIKNKIDHQDFRGIHHYMHKHNEYASWEASRYIRSRDNYSSWTLKQRIKYSLMNSVFIGPVYFIGSFIMMGGIRDGVRGLAFSILKSSYFVQIYCRIKELQGVNKK